MKQVLSHTVLAMLLSTSQAKVHHSRSGLHSRVGTEFSKRLPGPQISN